MMHPTAHFMAMRGNSPVLRPPAERAVAKSVEMPASGKTAEQAGNQETGFWGKDGFSFGDLLDIINPLQHIPIVSTMYRAATGDELSPAARLAGGTLMGGPIGFVVSLANAVTAQATGKDVGETIVASLISSKPVAKETQTASVALPAGPSPGVAPEKKEVELAMAEMPKPLGKPMETLSLKKGEAHFMPLPERVHSAKASSPAKEPPALKALQGFEALETEPLFPAQDDRKLEDWYEEHAALSPQLDKVRAHYQRAQTLGIAPQAGLDIKS